MAFQRTLCTARHEAAHAVIAEALGVRVRLVEITGHGTGLVTYDLRCRCGVLARAMIALAGTVAQQLWHRLPRSRISSEDGRKVFRCLAGLEAGRDYRPLHEITTAWVACSKREIDAVAHELVKRDLTGAEVRKVIRRARRKRGR